MTTERQLAGVTAARYPVETENLESSSAAISSGAIIGGAIATLSVSFLLIALGSALGLAVASPWSDAGPSLSALGVGAAIWLVVVQWLASGFGGYLTGRLRTKWAAMKSDEVFFRDTAHGFLAWGLSTVVVVTIFASAIGGGANIAATIGSGVAEGTSQAGVDQGNAGPMAGYVDSLFRSSMPGGVDAAREPNSDVRGETARLLMKAMTGEVAPADRSYLAGLVAARTELDPADAEARVDEVVTAAKQAADDARTAASAFSFLTALSLLIGAFVAASAGALGGRHRDEI